MVIGISGYARVGKDTFAASLKKCFASVDIESEIASFAGQLKLNIDAFLKQEFGISAFTSNDDEKKIIRPMLVAYGNTKRSINEHCWIRALESRMTPNTISIIPDVRFPNEADWIVSQGGHIIHIDRDLGDGSLVQPANDDEKTNTPIVKQKACADLVWQSTTNQDDIDEIVATFVLSIFQKEVQLWRATFPSLTK
jgi:hypothetical protein